MNVKCPYCAHLFPPSPKTRCPACGKSVLPPGFYQRRRRRTGTSPVPRPTSPIRRPIRRPLASRTLVCTVALLVLTMAALPVILRTRPAPEPSETYRQRLAHDNMAVLHIALDQLRKDTGRYPLTREGLASLIHNPSLPGWNGPYIFELKPDPWKRRFEYESEGQRISLFSAGPDGIPGSDDDLSIVTISP